MLPQNTFQVQALANVRTPNQIGIRGMQAKLPAE